jgi:hypothetical protein
MNSLTSGTCPSHAAKCITFDSFAERACNEAPSANASVDKLLVADPRGGEEPVVGRRHARGSVQHRRLDGNRHRYPHEDRQFEYGQQPTFHGREDDALAGAAVSDKAWVTA